MKVSLFVHDLSKNPIGRADPFIRILKKIGYSVEIIGFTIKENKIWAPYAGIYSYKSLHIRDNLFSLLINILPLARLASGDVIFSFKPIATTFLPAYLASKGGKAKPLYLDVEDDEYGTELVYWKRALKILTQDLGRCVNPLTTSFVNALLRCRSGTTVVSKKLQRYYDGDIVLTTPDLNIYDPDRRELNQSLCRKKWDLPLSKKIIMFIGSPAAHKGIPILSESIHMLSEDIVLVLVGNDHRYIFDRVAHQLGPRCIRKSPLSRLAAPELLAASDIVVIPQVKGSFAEAQVPAKLLDAMAMRKLVIVSDVSDMREIMGYSSDEKRGWMVENLNPRSLADAIQWVIDHPEEARRRAERARKYLLEFHSDERIGSLLSKMINKKR